MKITVRVTPRASADKIVEKDGLLRVYVTAAPADGKANATVIKLLAKRFGVPPSRVSIVRGAASRNKTVEIPS